MNGEARTYYKRLLIAGGVIALVGFTLVLLSMPTSSEPRQLDARAQQAQKLEQADEDMIAAALDVYYSNVGEYPPDIDSVMQYQEEQNKQVVQGGIDRMVKRHLVYIVPNDRKSYSFNYKSVTSKTVTHDGTYSEAYNR